MTLPSSQNVGTVIVNPECTAGKHSGCSGGWDMSADRPAPCPCECHREEEA